MIAIHIATKNMTLEQHEKGRKMLKEAGADESTMKVHAVFGEDGQLRVFDIWNSQESFDKFMTVLQPILMEMGVELAEPPAIMPVLALEQ